MGLMAAQFCKMRGAGRVIGIDSIPERLLKARELGVDTIDYKSVNVVSTLHDVLPNGLDVAIGMLAVVGCWLFDG